MPLMFQVRPEMLTAYGNVVDVHHTYAETARSYVEKNTHLDTAALSLLDKLYQSHQKIVNDVTTSLGQLRAVSLNSGAELRRAAIWYVENENEHVRRLDDSYGRVTVSRAKEPRTTDEITEAEQPENKLAPPTIPDEYPDFTSLFSKISDRLSPSWYVAQVLEILHLTNPADDLAKMIVGDWKAYARCASTWHNLAGFYGAVAHNIEVGNAELDRSWQGNAADACYDYFSKLAAKLRTIESKLENLGHRYTAVAIGVWKLANSLAGLITGIQDDAVWIALEIAAGDATFETGVGPAALWSLAGVQCARLIEKYNKTVEGFTGLANLVEDAVAWFAAAANQVDPLAGERLPGHYDHPEV
ncbi:hypothetical protein [Amycolatopsis sp. WGS_07]|uniref:hypothetical protein n=1 Tax=Amycolatopsis sp. WGS_07 TaxID=3076764 RepID=UPI003872F85D